MFTVSPCYFGRCGGFSIAGAHLAALPRRNQREGAAHHSASSRRLMAALIALLPMQRGCQPQASTSALAGELGAGHLETSQHRPNRAKFAGGAANNERPVRSVRGGGLPVPAAGTVGGQIQRGGRWRYVALALSTQQHRPGMVHTFFGATLALKTAKSRCNPHKCWVSRGIACPGFSCPICPVVLTLIAVCFVHSICP